LVVVAILALLFLALLIFPNLISDEA